MYINDLYRLWSTNTYFDQATRDELMAISENEDEIYDRFYRELEFGTAGIRGVIGAGTNRINKYIVRRVTYALVETLKQRGPEAMKRGVVIGCDTRNFSMDFAKEAAAILAGKDVKVYFNEDVAPVPFLSYCVRKLNCELGIMITASHNPKEYNGYKVYGADGAQIAPEVAAKVTEIINGFKDITTLVGFNFSFFKDHGKIHLVNADVKKRFMNEIKNLTVDQKLVKENAANLNVVYTPLHGNGAKWVPEILKQLGYTNVYPVQEQMEPNGDFPTVPVPNPEVRACYDLGVKLAAEKGANLIIATDPDADRLGAFIRDTDGEYIMLNGNQLGSLMLDYILSTKKRIGNLPKNGFAVSTIVSSDLPARICEAYGISFYQVLTGFKFIGEQIVKREENGDQKYLFGFEESYGYLAGTYARDKDAVAAAVMLTEVACYYNTKGMTLLDAIEEIYAKYGYFCDRLVSLELKGEAGLVKMKGLMENLRTKKFEIIPGIKKIIDIKESVEETADGSKTSVDLPKSNVLKFCFDNGWFVVRPSGTEPKIKIYFNFANKNSMEDALSDLEAVKAPVLDYINKFINN